MYGPDDDGRMSPTHGHSNPRAPFRRDEGGGKLPHAGSTAEERVMFVRAKYESCAFVFPVGPLANAVAPVNKGKKDSKDGQWEHQHQSQVSVCEERSDELRWRVYG